MKNDTNQIMKLNIPIWIKYWLSKHKNASYILSEILTGTEFFLQDSAPKKFKIFDIIGITTQESDPTPENPVPIKNTGDNVNLSSEDEITLTGPINKKLCDFGDGRTFEKISFTIMSDNATYNASTSALFKYINQNNTEVYIYLNDMNVTGSSLSGTYTYTLKNVTIKAITLLNWAVIKGTIKIKIEDGEPTPFSPYGCGNVNEKIENKNLFDKSKATSGRYVKNTDGTLGYSDTLSASDFIKVRANVTYYQSNVNNYYSCLYDEDKNFIKQINSNAFTPTKNGYMRTSFLATNIDIVQVEQGSTETDHVSHSEQNISFPLAEGQKFYEGSYPDDDEKVHHKRKQKIFDGSDDENWSLQSINSNGIANFAIGLADYSGRDENLSFCDYFSSQSTPIAQTTNEGYYLTISKTLYIRIKSTTASTVAELRTWLSTHNITFEYELAEEQTEDFTEEQKTAWEQIKKARTYKNVTHISSEDETPANLRIQYYKEG